MTERRKERKLKKKKEKTEFNKETQYIRNNQVSKMKKGSKEVR